MSTFANNLQTNVNGTSPAGWMTCQCEHSRAKRVGAILDDHRRPQHLALWSLCTPYTAASRPESTMYTNLSPPPARVYEPYPVLRNVYKTGVVYTSLNRYILWFADLR